MPIMLRTDKKAKKIVYSILGKPANMQKTRVSKRKKTYEEISADKYYDRMKI